MIPIVDRLLRDPILAKCNYAALSRLLPYIEEQSFPAGTTIYKTDSAASDLFVIISGEIRLHTPDGEIHTPSCARVGEECATEAQNYLADAKALTDVVLLRIPGKSLRPLVVAQPTLKNEFLYALMSHITGNRLQTQQAKASAKKKSGNPTLIIGWLLAIALPILTLQVGAHYDMDRSAAMFLAIFSATVTMWVFSLVDDYVPGLFAVMAILISGLVPPIVVLSGFSSDGFLMAMSILGLSTVIVTSGLSYRAMLLMLRHLPNNRFWHNFGLTFAGLLLTPLVPSINGRVSLVTPFFSDMVQNLRFAHLGRAATQLCVSAFAGVSLLSAMFISSKTVNFAVFGLLPAQMQDQFQGFKWLIASTAALVVLLGAHAVLTAIMFRSEEISQLAKERITAQLELMGKLKQREWAALIGIGVFLIGMMTASVHRIQPPWLGLAVLYGLLLFGSLSKKELTEKIDWPFLLYLSGLTGLVSAFNYLGLDHQLAAALPGLGGYMRESFGLFVLLLFGLVFVIRLLVPISATIVILATLFMPLAEIYGVNPWVVGFVILILGEMWYLPYQCSYYLQLQAFNRENGLYNEKTFLYYNGAMNLVRLAAIYISIPFWKAMGLL